MNRPTIPKNQISGRDAYFHLFRAAFFEPVDFFGVETMPVVGDGSPCRFFGFAVGFEECSVEVLGTFEDDQTSVFGAVGSEVDDSLGAVETLMMGVLVDVWPGV